MSDPCFVWDAILLELKVVTFISYLRLLMLQIPALEISEPFQNKP